MKGLFLWERPLVPWVIKVPFQGRQGEDLPVKMPGSCLSHAHSEVQRETFVYRLAGRPGSGLRVYYLLSTQSKQPNQIFGLVIRSFCQFHQN